MGGGLYDNMWNPYSNDGYGYPQSRSYRSREGVPERGAFNRAAQEPVKKVVRTIPVMDGNERKASVPERKAPVPVKARFESKDAAATKIQAAFRGYCVRKFQPLKNLKVIRAVQGELDTFKNRFQETEQQKKLLSVSQERLRWAEGIMALLLRLDSLQGVSPEVRLIRKALSKELLMFQETIDTLSMDSAQLNGKENSSEDAEVTDAAAPEDAEVIDAAAPEDAEVTDAAAPEDAEVTDAASREDTEAINPAFRKAAGQIAAALHRIVDVAVDGVTDAASQPHMSAFHKSAEGIIAAMRRGAELRKASLRRDADVTHAEAPEAAEVINAAAPQEVVETHAEPESMDIEGSPTKQDQDMSEAHAEVPMDVENKKEQALKTLQVQVLTALQAQALTTLQAQEVSVSPSASLPNAGVEAETAASLVENQEDDFVIVAPPEPEDASVTEMKSIEQDAEDMTMEVELRRDAIAEASIVPATTALPPASMETPSSPTSELSDRALLLQVLEENRKLRDVVSKVLQWGKHQNDTIHNLTSRIEQLEQHQPPLKQLEKKGRKVGHKRVLIGDIDSKDADSDEYF